MADQHDDTTQHYLEVASSGGPSGSPHPIGQFRLAASVLDQLHKENARRDAAGLPRLAVGFPHLAENRRDPVGRIRVFGTKAEIEAFRSGLVDLLLASPGDPAKVTKVVPVPKKHNLVAFQRDRSADRECQGYGDRALRRAQRKSMQRLSRGEALEKPPMDSAERAERMAARARNLAQVPRTYLKMASRSTRQTFSLFIVANGLPSGAHAGSVDVYGLSRETERHPVPHF